MTPRRSSRARASQAPAGVLHHSASSSSSNSLGRPERNTRSNNKLSSSRRSSTLPSQSVDDADARSRHDVPHTRQRQRGRDDDEKPPVNDEFEDEDGEEEEITRCICGQQDYPGLPPSAREMMMRNSLKAGIKEESNQDPAALDILSEDAGSLFIQCDSCKVWQHGGCVGIMEEALSPDEYFCEKCRKDLHRLVVSGSGQKSSQYLPVAGTPSPPSSTSSVRGTSRSAKDKKSKDHGDPPKRRSTMNSREAAYDEEDLLRRAIEESKEESKSAAEDTSSRRGKRNRSGSETPKHSAKRQRTGSPSSSSIVSKSAQPQSRQLSDEEKPRSTANGSKKTRGTVTRNQREKEAVAPEKDTEKELPPEPTGRRKGRSDRRKDDDSELDATSPTKVTVNGSVPPQSAPETSDIPPPPAQKPSARKSGRPPARRGRVGRNQYTRDRDMANGNSTGDQNNSPRRGQSREENGDSPGNNGANGVQTNGGESGKPSRPRYMNPNRTTMNDMRRRVAAILEFISRMQVEMAASGEQTTPPNRAGSNGTRAPDSTTVAAAIEGAVINGDIPICAIAESAGPLLDGCLPPARDFKDLSSGEMMDELTRGLLKWQQEFGKYGEK
ncbi:Histone deacetylase complex subunit [Ophidiomyces ophidiicola]|nr:Histone deacetylase complex subunit [Ophidiomyces ophidiicola]KAI2010973.1 Histone deacetylase complex subunit [Ophidiomyces ophidiicola]KAI2023285.1 Histone deacetylase complex subunit [Ophidiomyces ophidiicola]KAI2130049.1 Histone deacetylase complex subunit [Ophidiomyces ophidiicola]KAI2134559.1 Histone deacetylase complex subunit [Ophidiomyces ophidiicola]